MRYVDVIVPQENTSLNHAPPVTHLTTVVSQTYFAPVINSEAGQGALQVNANSVERELLLPGVIPVYV